MNNHHKILWPSFDLKDKLFWAVTAVFMFVKLSLHLLTNTNYELHRDEMLYFNMADHLSFGYASVPPVIGFLAFLVKSVFGYSVFGIRLLPALAGVATIYLTAKIVKDLGGGFLALIIALTSFLLSPGFLLFDTLFTPNVFEQFVWTWILYLMLRMVNTNNPKIWVSIGILLGISFLIKYSVLFLIAGFFFALLLSSHRKLLVSKYFYWAIAIGVLICLPNLIWQYNHNLPVFYHYSELQRSQMTNMTRINYFIDLFSLNIVATLIWLFGLVALILFKRERKYQFFGIASLLIIFFFMLWKGKGFYNLGLIPFLFAIGAFAMEKYFVNRLKLISYATLLVVIPTSLLAMPFALPLLTFGQMEKYSERLHHPAVVPFIRWEDGKIHPVNQAFADMTGWKELVGIVANAYCELTLEEQKNCTIYGERTYGYAGAINFYGEKYNLPDAFTFNDCYVIWAPDTIPFGPMIYINYGKNGIDKLFENVKVAGKVNDPYFREMGLKVFLCTNPRPEVLSVYQQLAIEEKKVYQKQKR